jgi:hypothetical protein
MKDEWDTRDDVAPAYGGHGPDSAAAEAPTGAAAIFGPFFNAVFAPAQTWKALDAKPSLSGWMVVLIAVFTTVLAVINLPITQQVMVQSTRAQMRASGQELSPEQVQQMADNMMTFGSVAAYGSAIFVVIGIAIIALLVWVMASIMGGKGSTFGRAFGVAAGAAVIHPTLYGIYASIILNMNPPEIRRIEDASTVAPTLGLDLILAGPDTPAWLEVLFQRIDLFNLWWAFLIVSGSMALLKLKQGAAITVALIIWALFTLIAMGGALVQGLASG